MTGDIAGLVAHLRDEHKVDMHNGCTFNHRYVKSNPQEVENATWMLTVSMTVDVLFYEWTDTPMHFVSCTACVLWFVLLFCFSQVA